MIHKFSFIEKILLRLNIIPHPIIDSLSRVRRWRAHALHQALLPMSIPHRGGRDRDLYEFYDLESRLPVIVQIVQT